jgi:hypothetical protein
LAAAREQTSYQKKHSGKSHDVIESCGYRQHDKLEQQDERKRGGELFRTRRELAQSKENPSDKEDQCCRCCELAGRPTSMPKGTESPP